MNTAHDLISAGKLLELTFGKGISDIEQIPGGERSSAFGFRHAHRSLILHISSSGDGFMKDSYAARTYGRWIPVAEVLRTGMSGDEFFAVSERIPGEPLKSSTGPDSSLSDELIRVLDRMKSIPVPPDTGYGPCDGNGTAGYSTWDTYVLRDHTPVTSGGRFISWKEARNRSFVDGSLIDAILGEIRTLLQYIPCKRYLIHGDFGPGNLMIKDGRVTGIIDWSESGYGDFLYDVAWLDFWMESLDFAHAYAHAHPSELNYLRRIRCHKLTIGLTVLGIYAAINVPEAYGATEKRVLDLMAQT